MRIVIRIIIYMHQWYSHWDYQYLDSLELYLKDHTLIMEEVGNNSPPSSGIPEGSFHTLMNNYFQANSSELEIIRRKVEDQWHFNSTRSSNFGDYYNCNTIYNDKGNYPSDLILTERQRGVLHMWLKSVDANYNLRYDEEKGFQMFTNIRSKTPLKPNRLLLRDISLGCADNSYNDN